MTLIPDPLKTSICISVDADLPELYKRKLIPLSTIINKLLRELLKYLPDPEPSITTTIATFLQEFKSKSPLG